jgi:peptide-methionine (S)-S-oxide reductase
LEAVYLQVRGVLSVESGYSNGQAQQPTYEAVCSGSTGCAEVVQLKFDPARISLSEILDVFFLIHDPTTLNRQGHDVGSQYRSGIYLHTPQQAQEVSEDVQRLERQALYADPIVTEVLPLAHYWPAEAYHQNYYARNPYQGYCVHVVSPKLDKLRRKLTRLVAS